MRQGPWKVLKLAIAHKRGASTSVAVSFCLLLWPHYSSRPTNWDNKRQWDVASSGSCLNREVMIISPGSWPLKVPELRSCPGLFVSLSLPAFPRWLEPLEYKGPTLGWGERVAESQVGCSRGLEGCCEFYSGKELVRITKAPSKKGRGAWGSNLGLTSSRNWISRKKETDFPKSLHPVLLAEWSQSTAAPSAHCRLLLGLKLQGVTGPGTQLSHP